MNDKWFSERPKRLERLKYCNSMTTSRNGGKDTISITLMTQLAVAFGLVSVSWTVYHVPLRCQCVWSNWLAMLDYLFPAALKCLLTPTVFCHVYPYIGAFVEACKAVFIRRQTTFLASITFSAPSSLFAMLKLLFLSVHLDSNRQDFHRWDSSAGDIYLSYILSGTILCSLTNKKLCNLLVLARVSIYLLTMDLLYES